MKVTRMATRKYAGRGVLASVAIAGSLIHSPTASADDYGDIFEDSAARATCSVAGSRLASWATKASKLPRVGLLAEIAGGAAGLACPKLIKKWRNGDSAPVAVRTPTGRTVTQQLSLDDLAGNPPAETWVEKVRSAQCSGWKAPVLFNMCVDGELDPIYR